MSLLSWEKQSGFWGDLAGGTAGWAGGAAAGAAIGSIIPGAGTVAGGIIGAGLGLAGGLAGSLIGGHYGSKIGDWISPDKPQAPNYTEVMKPGNYNQQYDAGIGAYSYLPAGTAPKQPSMGLDYSNGGVHPMYSKVASLIEYAEKKAGIGSSAFGIARKALPYVGSAVMGAAGTGWMANRQVNKFKQGLLFNYSPNYVKDLQFGTPQFMQAVQQHYAPYALEYAKYLTAPQQMGTIMEQSGTPWYVRSLMAPTYSRELGPQDFNTWRATQMS